MRGLADRAQRVDDALAQPLQLLDMLGDHGTQKLLRAEAKEVKVTTAAMDWGFWHLGEFAAGYKRLFGELPSQTLQRRDPRPVLEVSRPSAAPRRNDAVAHHVADAAANAAL